MNIIGLDPGIARTGYGVIQKGQPSTMITCGCLTTPAGQQLEDRLITLGENLTELLHTYKPDLAVVESIFFGNNKKTAITTAHVRGVLIYVLRSHHVPIQTLTPLQIKSRLTGYGSASKEQMQTVVKNILKLQEVPKPDDAADALAAALCAL